MHSAYILEHFVYILEHSGTFWNILEHYAYILEHSGTFCIHSAYILEHSGTDHMLKLSICYVKFLLETHMDRQTDIRTC